MEKMGDAYVKMFKQQQGIASDEELARLAEADGMTFKQVRQRLAEMYAPPDIIDMEVINRISVSDREIEGYYEENSQAYLVDGEVTLREIVLLAEDDATRDARRAEAEAIFERSKTTEDFAALAMEVSEAGTAPDGGKIGPVKRADLSERLAEPAFSLPTGSVSPLMETPYGFHFVKVESRMDDHMQSLDDVRQTIRKQLEDRKFRAELEVFMEKARAESEWCVEPKHLALLSLEESPPCKRL
jgi:parvulin-like peptidyl-prolyl isomerase